MINVIGIVEASYAGNVPRVLTAPPHGGVLARASLIFFASLGFEELANLVEEARDPERDLPRAILITVAVTTGLYVMVAMASVALLDPAAMARSSSTLADAIQAGAPRLVVAMDAVALFATADTVFITVTATSRMLLDMARGGDAPGVPGPHS